MNIKNVLCIILVCAGLKIHSSSAPAAASAGVGSEAAKYKHQLAVTLKQTGQATPQASDVLKQDVQTQRREFVDFEKRFLGLERTNEPEPLSYTLRQCTKNFEFTKIRDIYEFMIYSAAIHKIPELTAENWGIVQFATAERAQELTSKMQKAAQNAQSDIQRLHYLMAATFVNMMQASIAHERLKKENKELKKQLTALKIANESMSQVPGGSQQNIQPSAAK